MKNIQATGEIFGKKITLKQISKTSARVSYELGNTVYLQTSNFYPIGVWSSAIPINKKDVQDNPIMSEKYNSFDDRVNSFEYYNCSNETGKYTHFYKEI